MKTHFDDSWKHWIWTNVAAGNDKNGIFKILLDEGYDYQAIKAEMNYEPDIPVFMIPNPLKKQSASQGGNQQGETQHAKAPSRFLANSLSLSEDKAEMYLVEEFLNPEEAATLITLIRSQLRPSTLSSEEADSQFRTSQTCELGALDHPLINDVDQRICQYLGIDQSYSEGIQGQFYEIGQEFKPHTDYFESHEMATHGGKMGQRTYTFMLYLNDVEEGGETTFPQLDQAFKPALGSAVVWNNLDENGQPNYNTLHHATPVKKGTKAVITKWFRQHSYQTPAPEVNCKEPNEFIPNYTKVGFEKRTLPEDLFAEICQFYASNKKNHNSEHVPGDFISSSKSRRASSLVELSDSLRQKIHDVMKPMMESWSQSQLEPTYVYGIRIYHRGAALKCHRDRLETHIISVIINVSQDVDEPWPLVIEDNWYRKHQVLLQPGDMVFYEGGRLLHGRPEPLNGDEFANIFCHFKPVAYVPPSR